MTDSQSSSEFDLSESVLEAAFDRGETLLVDDLIALAERADENADGAPGVTSDRLVAYVEELSRRGLAVDPDGVRTAVEERAVESETWVDADALYHVGDGRVSIYPRRWYDELAGETDLTRYVAVVLDDVGDSESAFAQGGAGPGVPERVLLSVAGVAGGLTRDEAKAELERLRDEGVVVEDADQHPNARVRLVDESETE
jgi:hypothetical protein